nr:MAG TPA: hypothetical protein [Caudoviricetes sp.]DAT22442.1 MAG TPA: hypothetical protein [Caudoviricetes sp.]
MIPARGESPSPLLNYICFSLNIKYAYLYHSCCFDCKCCNGFASQK